MPKSTPADTARRSALRTRSDLNKHHCAQQNAVKQQEYLDEVKQAEQFNQVLSAKMHLKRFVHFQNKYAFFQFLFI